MAADLGEIRFGPGIALFFCQSIPVQGVHQVVFIVLVKPEVKFPTGRRILRPLPEPLEGFGIVLG